MHAADLETVLKTRMNKSIGMLIKRSANLQDRLNIGFGSSVEEVSLCDIDTKAGEMGLCIFATSFKLLVDEPVNYE